MLHDGSSASLYSAGLTLYFVLKGQIEAEQSHLHYIFLILPNTNSE